MRNAVGSKTSLVFTRNASALQKIDRSLNSSLDSSWFLVLFPSCLGGGGGWLNVSQKKILVHGAWADKVWCIIFIATRVPSNSSDSIKSIRS